jgi:phospholipid/cholesterol/gamma-HCH transport system ATP-binding protein
VISLRDISLRLKGKPVLRHVHLDIPPGGVFALIGPGASGKSVLFKVITGLLPPTRGEVSIDGECINDLPPLEIARVRKRIGMLFQNNALFDHMSVAENIAFPLRRLFDYGEEQIEEIIAERLSRVSLGGFQERFPPGLSGGQKKRVGIARATAQRAPIVLYDEPTAGLDPVNSQKIFNLIRDEQRAQGTTAVVISSDVGGLLTIADRVAMLHRGELLFSGSASEAKSSNTPAVRQFVHGLTEGPL